MTESTGFKRVTCKRRRPNQHFHELLESLYRVAVENKSSIVPSLKEALSSLAKYPLPLSSGAECAILKGFDKRLCRYIDKHYDQQLNNKKNKVAAIGKDEPAVEDLEMTSKLKKNRRKSKNVAGCKGNSDRHKDSNLDDEEPIYEEEKNNNTSKLSSEDSKELPSEGSKELPSDESEPVSLDNYFETRSRREARQNIHSQEESDLEERNLSASLDLCNNWDCFTDNLQSTSRAEIRTLCQPIVVTDQSEDEDPVAEINLSSDEEITYEQNNQCIPNKETVHGPCESTSVDPNAMLYFKETSKRDGEEIARVRKWANKIYKPAYRSGAYAILVALQEQCNECPYRDCLTKEELIQKAQKHTDQSFINPKPESTYTAWTNAKRLINKGMIEIKNFIDKNEDFYMLTALGNAVAMELLKENSPKVTVNDVIFHGQRNDRVPSLEGLEEVTFVPPPAIASVDEDQSTVFIEMPAGTFDIIMLIDKRENFDKSQLASPNYFCRYEARSLTIGDFVWIARSRKTGQELVLPYIVERKRMDDLASSIKDGRFHEQKFRLRKCGLQNVVYLVESYKMNGQYGLPAATLMQAVVNTSILEEFNIAKTDSLEDTFRFLGLFSDSLAREYLPIVLRGCNQDTQGKELMTFEFFNKFSCKNKPLTVRDTFIKMLLQLKGLSIEKALAITHKYSTPRLLMKAYEKCTVKEGELLLANLKFNNFSRNVGPSVSKAVYKLFSKEM